MCVLQVDGAGVSVVDRDDQLRFVSATGYILNARNLKHGERARRVARRRWVSSVRCRGNTADNLRFALTSRTSSC